MPNIESALLYIKNEEVLQKTFNKNSVWGLFTKPVKLLENSNVKVQVVDFASKTLGTYNASTGYPAIQPLVSWVDRKISQDKGNVIPFDIVAMGDAIVEGIATVHNHYLQDVMFPAYDSYGAGVIEELGNGVQILAGVPTENTILKAIIDARALIADARFKTDKLVLVAPFTTLALLEKLLSGTGRLVSGVYNENLQTSVLMIDNSIAVVGAPQGVFSGGTYFVLAHPDAITPVIRYSNVEITSPTGFAGRMKQEEIGYLHDFWIEPGAEKAIVVAFAKPRLSRVGTGTAIGDKIIVLADTGTTIRYTDTGTAPADASSGSAYPDGGITIANGKTYKIVAFKDGVASDTLSVAQA